MGKPIIKLRDGDKDWYLVWSTVVDAPVSYGMTRDQLMNYIKDEYGAAGLRDMPERLARLDTVGTTSIMDDSAEDTMSCNRAGLNETELTAQQIVEMYCRGKDTPGIEGAKPDDEDDDVHEDDGRYELGCV